MSNEYLQRLEAVEAFQAELTSKAKDAAEFEQLKIDTKACVELALVRGEMANERDPIALGRLAIRARELRGHKDLFSDPN